MKRIYCFLFLVICLSASFTIAQEITRFSIGNKSSVLNRLAADKSFLYVSNIPNDINEVNGEGFISKLDKSGKVIESRFIDKLDYPQSMVIINNVLYVVDSGRIKGFNLKTKRQVFNLKMNGTSVLGDIIAWDNNTLLASDFAGMILSIDIRKKSYSVLMPIESSLGIPYLLARYGDKLYVVTSDSNGRILSIDINTKDVSYVSELSGRFYGIAITQNGGILAVKEADSLDGVESGYDEAATMLYNITSQGQVFIVDLQDLSANIYTFIVDSNDVWFIDMAGVDLIRISI